MPTLLPRDSDNTPIPAVRLRADGGAHAIDATDTSDRNETAFATTTRIVSVFATVPVYLRFGDEDVEADEGDHYFPTGIYYDFSVGGDKVPHHTHLAVLAVEDEGMVYISEKE